jgi:hypothetical protein
LDPRRFWVISAKAPPPMAAKQIKYTAARRSFMGKLVSCPTLI